MPTDQSANLGLPYVMPAQAQKHVTVNDGLRRLDALVQTGVESRSVTVEPASPSDGAVWVLPAGATGAAWSLMTAGSLAYYRDGAWSELAPGVGWRAWIADEGLTGVYDGVRWRVSGEALNDTPFGASTAMRALEAEVTLAGPETDLGVVIPNRAIVFAVSTRTTEAVQGATSYDCGVPSEANKFGGLLGAAMGSTNVGVVGPTAYYADTPVRFTANGGDFTGGRVRAVIHYLECLAPSA